MHRDRALACLPLLLATVASPAQAGPSQARLEDDCLQRLRPLVPREVKPKGADFSALGSNVAYYVVSWRFTGALENGARAAACTYRRDGQWVRDDAAAWKLARDLEPGGRRGKPD